MSSKCPNNPPPVHVAVIMDGNRRWAKARYMPVLMGHRAGAARLREVVQGCVMAGVRTLTVFAFSTENWRRPPAEVEGLMRLFATYLKREVRSLMDNRIRLLVLGDRSRFASSLLYAIDAAELATRGGDILTLNVCVNYGGRWDMLNAFKRLVSGDPSLDIEGITEEQLVPYLCAGESNEVDLLIRTGGESRISNFMLWQSAYAELYFTKTLWPDFGATDLRQALDWYASRDRRFGAVAKT